MRKFLAEYRKYLKNREYSILLIQGLVFLITSLAVHFLASRFATKVISNPVNDLILDNVPLVNVGLIFVEGALILTVFGLFLVFSHPKFIPFSAKATGLFIFIRSGFNILTHLGPPVSEKEVLFGREDFFGVLTGGDYFFSGHTGFPFLLALIFWNYRGLRWFFLATSIIFGTSALLGHLHYSIDVFGAFFITYAIFRISRAVFKRDRQIFFKGLETKEIKN